MKRCKHENAGAKWVGTQVWRTGGGDQKQWFIGATWETPDAIVCPDCRDWLSLGESNDEPEAVKVEMRAAELAAGYTKERGVIDGTTLDEDIGFLAYSRGGDVFGPEQHRGYLSHCIVDHDASAKEGR